MYLSVQFKDNQVLSYRRFTVYNTIQETYGHVGILYSMET